MRCSRTIRTAVFVTAVLLIQNSVHATVSNGSFETPIVTVGSFTEFTTSGQGLTNWNVVGATGSVDVVSGAFSSGGVTFQAQEGVQWLDLTGTSNTATGVAQTIITTPGNRYQLDYFIGNTTGGVGLGTTSTVNVILNGIQTYSDTNSNSAPTNMNWKFFSHEFIAAGNSITIAFLNGDGFGDNVNGLDTVSFIDLGTSEQRVAEPATLALLGMGLFGIAASRRRKSS